ncbi:hypothetical protein ACU686_17915 [Yinghuangia aomiensis]
MLAGALERVDGQWIADRAARRGPPRTAGALIDVAPAWAAVQVGVAVAEGAADRHPVRARGRRRDAGEGRGPPATWNLSMQAEALAARARFFQSADPVRVRARRARPEAACSNAPTRRCCRAPPTSIYHVLVPSTRSWPCRPPPRRASRPRAGEARARAAARAPAEAGGLRSTGPVEVPRRSVPLAPKGRSPAAARRRGGGLPARSEHRPRRASHPSGPRRRGTPSPPGLAAPGTSGVHRGSGRDAGRRVVRSHLPQSRELAEESSVSGRFPPALEVDRLRALRCAGRASGRRSSASSARGRYRQNRLIGTKVVPEGRHIAGAGRGRAGSRGAHRTPARERQVRTWRLHVPSTRRAAAEVIDEEAQRSGDGAARSKPGASSPIRNRPGRTWRSRSTCRRNAARGRRRREGAGPRGSTASRRSRRGVQRWCRRCRRRCIPGDLVPGSRRPSSRTPPDLPWWCRSWTPPTTTSAGRHRRLPRRGRVRRISPVLRGALAALLHREDRRRRVGAAAGRQGSRRRRALADVGLVDRGAAAGPS